ncbi:hypothetical protein FF38_08674 [Lucilia cuprina]|uniref:Uncharacterized protein n=1 Tax=Lucilia cuprina TaxID=7375 RepID=A0A0L0CB53_LUCCU|nr:hypothetical protein FF38_08674 [Lucilia cuprina]
MDVSDVLLHTDVRILFKCYHSGHCQNMFEVGLFIPDLPQCIHFYNTISENENLLHNTDTRSRVIVVKEVEADILGGGSVYNNMTMITTTQHIVVNIVISTMLLPLYDYDFSLVFLSTHRVYEDEEQGSGRRITAQCYFGIKQQHNNDKCDENDSGYG